MNFIYFWPICINPLLKIYSICRIVPHLLNNFKSKCNQRTMTIIQWWRKPHEDTITYNTFTYSYCYRYSSFTYSNFIIIFFQRKIIKHETNLFIFRLGFFTLCDFAFLKTRRPCCASVLFFFLLFCFISFCSLLSFGSVHRSFPCFFFFLVKSMYYNMRRYNDTIQTRKRKKNSIIAL